MVLLDTIRAFLLPFYLFFLNEYRLFRIGRAKGQVEFNLWHGQCFTGY
jgi:hypothetical protein